MSAVTTETPPTPPPPSDFNAAFKPLAMTGSGLPVMLDDEVEVITREDTTMYSASQSGDFQERLVGGATTLTTHRLLWSGITGDGRRLSMCCRLSEVSDVRANRGGRFKSSSKVQIFLAGQPPDAAVPAILLRIETGRDEFIERMRSTLSRKAWVKFTTRDVINMYQAGAGAALAAAGAGSGGGGGGSSAAGVAAILQRQEMSRAVTAQVASDVSSDLGSLMDKARESIAVIERYSAALAKKRQEDAAAAAAAAAAGSGGGAGSADADGLGDLLLSMGISNPVTKGSAGTQYHQQLARQLADFLAQRNLLGRFGGVMTLPDVFAILNRARGTALVSPADLLEACALLKPLRLGMSLQRFDSGVLVVQSDRFDAAALGRKLRGLAEQSGWIIAPQAAREAGISVTLASEHLAEAERAGLLCRDETFEGLRFFPNRFEELARQWAEARVPVM